MEIKLSKKDRILIFRITEKGLVAAPISNSGRIYADILEGDFKTNQYLYSLPLSIDSARRILEGFIVSGLEKDS